MNAVRLGICSAILMFVVISPSGAQETEGSTTIDSTCVQIDLADLIRNARGIPPQEKKESSGSLLLLPIIGSNPATGFMLGVGGQYAFKMPGLTLYSLVSGSAQITTKGQLIFMLKNSVYTKNNRIFFSGDWRFLIYSQATYGLGTNAPEGGILDYQLNIGGLELDQDSLAQPMNFNFARLHQSVGWKVKDGIYLGFGYCFDSYFKIEDLKLDLGPEDTLITSHYAYNTNYGFNTEKYYSSAINVNITIDKRDNMINAHKGYYANVAWRGAFEFIGNRTTTNYFEAEWRSFHGVSKKNPAHLIAFWAMGNFSPIGDFPYMILPATAYDQRGRSARGYTQGRFRGNSMVYTEAEYRFPLSPCGGVLGGVLFVNATSAAHPTNDNVNLLSTISPSYGFGLRVMVDKRSLTNLAIDFGFGQNSFGFYLAASETF